MGPIYAGAATPSGKSTVNAASGPYAADASASKPKIGMPGKGLIFSCCSSSVRIRFPKQISFMPTNSPSMEDMPRFPRRATDRARLGLFGSRVVARAVLALGAAIPTRLLMATSAWPTVMAYFTTGTTARIHRLYCFGHTFSARGAHTRKATPSPLDPAHAGMSCHGATESPCR